MSGKGGASLPSYRKPAQWTDPRNKPFPRQVVFTCPPRDFCGGPTDFVRMAPDTVGVHGRILHIPDYEHRLDQRLENFALLEEVVECAADAGADVCAQVGSNWVHASNLGVEGIRRYIERLSETYATAFHMSGYAMVEALRAANVEKVALNAVYHWPDWWRGTVGFLREAGFDVVWAGNFVDQGWFASQEELNAQVFCFDEDLAEKSMAYVADKAPHVDAYLANGTAHFRRACDGATRRFVGLAPELEAMLGKPVITHDIALHWRIFKTLGMAPATRQGILLASLQQSTPGP